MLSEKAFQPASPRGTLAPPRGAGHRLREKGRRLLEVLRPLVPPPIAFAVLLIGLITTAAVVEREHQRASEQINARLEATIDDVEQALRDRFESYELVLNGVLGFYNSSDNLSRDAWRRYALDIGLHQRRAGIRALGFAQRVVGDEEARQLESDVRAEFFPEFRIKDLPNYPNDDADGPRLRHVMRYYEPIEANIAALGIDIHTNPASRDVQDRARDLGEISLTAPTRIIDSNGELSKEPNALVLYAPLYRRGEPSTTVAERRDAHAGFAVLPVESAYLFDPALQATTLRDLDIEVLDEAAGRIVWSSVNGQPQPLSETAAVNEETRTRLIEHGGRRWIVLVSPLPSFAGNYAADVRTAGAGIVATLLLMGLAWSQSTVRRRACRLAETMQRRAASLEARFSAAFHGCGSGMGLTDLRGKWISSNAALRRMLGEESCQPGGQPLIQLAHAEDRGEVIDAFGRILSGAAQHVEFDCRFGRPGEATVWGLVSLSSVGLFGEDRDADRRSSDCESPYLVVQVQDISEKKRAQRELERAARQDQLTGLATRAAFHEALASGFETTSDEVHRGQPGFAILFVDLDGFKGVNDTLGHEAGDQLLVGVAGRIRGELRGSGGRRRDGERDLPARIGGDEFVILIRGLRTPEAGSEIAQRVRRAICQPFQIHGEGVTVGASVGIATSFDEHATPEEMLRRADLAMYEAKRRGTVDPSTVVDADGHDDGGTTVPFKPRLAA